MQLEKARELIRTELQLGGGYNRNALRLILAEVQRAHGQGAVDALVAELELESTFGLRPGRDFSKVAG